MNRSSGLLNNFSTCSFALLPTNVKMGSDTENSCVCCILWPSVNQASVRLGPWVRTGCHSPVRWQQQADGFLALTLRPEGLSGHSWRKLPLGIFLQSNVCTGKVTQETYLTLGLVTLYEILDHRHKNVHFPWSQTFISLFSPFLSPEEKKKTNKKLLLNQLCFLKWQVLKIEKNWHNFHIQEKFHSMQLIPGRTFYLKE